MASTIESQHRSMSWTLNSSFCCSNASQEIIRPQRGRSRLQIFFWLRQNVRSSDKFLSSRIPEKWKIWSFHKFQTLWRWIFSRKRQEDIVSCKLKVTIIHYVKKLPMVFRFFQFEKLATGELTIEDGLIQLGWIEIIWDNAYNHIILEQLLRTKMSWDASIQPLHQLHLIENKNTSKRNSVSRCISNYLVWCKYSNKCLEWDKKIFSALVFCNFENKEKK